MATILMATVVLSSCIGSSPAPTSSSTVAPSDSNMPNSPSPSAGATAFAIEPIGALLGAVDGVGAVYAGSAQAVVPGDFEVTPAGGPPVLPKGVLAVGAGLSIKPPLILAEPVEVRLKLPPPPSPDAIPMVLHVSNDGVVTVEPGKWDPSTNEIIVRTDKFSDRFGLWYDPRQWFEETFQVAQGAFDWASDYLTGRTDAPPCREDEPKWASWSTQELSSVHACLQSNIGAGSDRAEVYLKSNRSTIQIIELPPLPADFVWREDQLPEPFPRLFAALAGVDHTRNLVLFGGDAMSAGYVQPLVSAEGSFRSYLTLPVMVVNGLAALVGGLESDDDILSASLAAYGCVTRFGLDPFQLDVVPTNFKDQGDVLEALIECAVEIAASPELVRGVVATLFGSELADLGEDLTKRVADRAAKGAERSKGHLDRMLRAMKAARGVGVSESLYFWDLVFDNIAAGDLTLRLNGKSSMLPSESPYLVGIGNMAAFVSPSKNISCIMDPEVATADLDPPFPTFTIACLVRQHSWPSDPRPVYEVCPESVSWAEDVVAIYKDGVSAGTCTGDNPTEPASEVLPYGESLQVGGLTCSSAETGITCADANLGGQFTVSTNDFVRPGNMPVWERENSAASTCPATFILKSTLRTPGGTTAVCENAGNGSVAIAALDPSELITTEPIVVAGAATTEGDSLCVTGVAEVLEGEATICVNRALVSVAGYRLGAVDAPVEQVYEEVPYLPGG